MTRFVEDRPVSGHTERLRALLDEACELLLCAQSGYAEGSSRDRQFHMDKTRVMADARELLSDETVGGGK